jgi:hypothetical protein
MPPKKVSLTRKRRTNQRKEKAERKLREAEKEEEKEEETMLAIPASNKPNDDENSDDVAHFERLRFAYM